MKICVLMKQVPDKDAALKINATGLGIDTADLTFVTNESDSYALEEALLLKEAHGGEVVVCTLGADSSLQVIKDALSKGADRGLYLRDDAFNVLDILSLSKVFVAALKDEDFDLIFSGLQSDDVGNGQLGLGDNTSRNIPTTISDLANAKQVGVGERHTIILME